MVQLDKVQGQKGHMVIHEDGSILSSSGELASSESTSQQMLNMLSHSLPVNFSTAEEGHDGLNGTSSQHGHASVNGGPAVDSHGEQIWKWNRLTVDFKDHSYVVCLSNKRIHVVKRDQSHHHSHAEIDQANVQQP